MTEIWYECPSCKKEINLDWETLAIIGEFTEHIKCKCGAFVNIHFVVTEAQHCGHPFSAIVGDATKHCSVCADIAERSKK